MNKRLIQCLWCVAAVMPFQVQAALPLTQLPIVKSTSPSWQAIAKPNELLAQSKFGEVNAIYEDVRASRERGSGGIFLFEMFFAYLPADPVPAIEERSRAWVRHSPKHVAAAVYRARVLIEHAKVQDKAGDWKQVDQLAAEALKVLMSVRDPGKRDSNWQSALLGVARLQGWKLDRVKSAIEEAVASDPYPVHQYIAASSALAASGNKDPKQLRWLLELVVSKTEGTEGQSMYARIPLEGARTWFPSVWATPLAAGNLEWNRLNQGMTDWYARVPSISVLIEHAALACIAGDKDVARELLTKFDPRQGTVTFRSYGGPDLYARCKQWAAPMPVFTRP